MSQSLTQLYLHVIFSTKGRRPFLQDRELLGRVHAYLVGVCQNLESPSLVVGGVADHVHLLCRLGKTCTIADLIRELKRESSKWIKTLASDLTDFSWQSGYGAFSISPGHVEPLKRYIAGQEAHHRRETFQEEFRRICALCGVALDERYAWD
ncbi:MAG: transposase [Planctomycetia bacterium]|nr:transposase [Planctomycetia bacterium]